MSTIPQTFLGLPRELRNETYIWALKDITRCRMESKGYSLTTFDRTEKRTIRRMKHSRLPSWVFTNKQILCEAIDTFARGRIFEMEGQVSSRGHSRPYEHAILAKSIRTLRLPDATAVHGGLRYKSSPLTIRCHQGRFLQAFMALRGKAAKPLHLIWTWYSDKFAYCDTSIPTVQSAELCSLASRFARVTITIELDIYTVYPILGLMDTMYPNYADRQEEKALIKFVRNGLLKHAEEWARRLVGCRLGSKIRCHSGQDELSEHWIGLETLTRSLTVERDLT